MSYKEGVPILEFKLKDETNKIIYKKKVPTNNIPQLAIILQSLESLGVMITRAVGQMIKLQEDEESWFRS